MNTITIQENNTQLVNPEMNKLAENALLHLSNSRASQTLKSYDSDFKHFEKWCAKQNLPDLPCSSETLILYIESLISKDYKFSTLERRKISINNRHKEKDFALPFDNSNEKQRLWWQGVRRSIGLAVEKKKPILSDDLKKIINTCSKSKNQVKAKRDVALLLVGFTGCMRRSKIVALNIENISFVKEGAEILIKKSKTDQEGKGVIKRICYASNFEYCAVRQLKAWVDYLKDNHKKTDGALFPKINRHGHLADRLTSQSLALIVKDYCKKSSMEYKNFAGHSLRSGLATTASMNGASLSAIMRTR